MKVTKTKNQDLWQWHDKQEDMIVSIGDKDEMSCLASMIHFGGGRLSGKQKRLQKMLHNKNFYEKSKG